MGSGAGRPRLGPASGLVPRTYTFHAATDPRVAAQTTRQITEALIG
ncbi:hypothetical protein ACFVX6_35990 [Streptomyces sp. NPDC058289]